MINTKHRLRVLLLQIVLLSTLIGITPVFGGTGSIRIDPPLPQVVTSPPADFTIWVQDNSTVYNPIIFLAMTNTSYQSLTGSVTVTWYDGDGGFATIPIATWQKPGSNSKLPPNASPGAGYQIASIKSHLGETEEEIWWATAEILDEPLYGLQNKTITVYLPATSPDMMVYILGSSSETGDTYDYDMKVPNTGGSRVYIPEVPYGTIAVMASMLVALFLYVKRPFF